MSPGLSVNLFCQDLDRVFDFYRQLFELEEAVEHRSPIYRALRIAGSDIGFHAPAAVALLNAGALRAQRPSVAHYPTFHVDRQTEVDALCARALQLGASLLKAPYLTYYRAWQAVLQDPEGNFFRINHYLS
ncbi:hypothetical protein SAMN04488038_11030 [Solimonas aquatica]|uniref:Glyoxalase-like domain-containing protein n=1 Tax=Solimonas aquatica TaxID=489703 RepID=A0A1H9IGV3_9GAMM|nr:VOC family protein [Solimonas aquatica]SEQ73778.1 hypothetical protein SAMN04488038_11030 [Solimonas aquatica]